MTNRELYDAIGVLDEGYCRAALREPNRKQKTGLGFRLTATAATAAVFALAFGGLTWFIASMKPEQLPAAQIPEPVAEISETTEGPAESTEPDSETTEEIVVQAEPIAFAELELHDNTPPAYSEAEEAEMLNEARERYVQAGCYPQIDRQPYLDKFREPWGDAAAYEAHFAELNELPYKSYIYHMMLNSVDYFRTAEGAFTYDELHIFFQTDMPAENSYTADALSAEDLDALLAGQQSAGTEYFMENGEYSYMVLTDGTYNKSHIGGRVGQIFRDNDRYYIRADGIPCAVNRSDPFLNGMEQNILLPQQFALKYLHDFESWRITGVEDFTDARGNTFCGAVITAGTCTMTVDAETGVLLELTDTGKTAGQIRVQWLELDTQPEVRRFDPAGLTETEPLRPIVPDLE